jgi:hypothetical protein
MVQMGPGVSPKREPTLVVATMMIGAAMRKSPRISG